MSSSESASEILPRSRSHLASARFSFTRAVHDLAYVEVASTELAREINRDILLECIRAQQPIARVDLVRHSGLQNSTVSSIVEQLLTEGWICEGASVKTHRGRRPIEIYLNPQLAILVADVHPGRATVAAVDLNGQLLSRASIALPADPQRGLEALGDEMLRTRDAHPNYTFEGAGVCLPGRIHPATHQLMLAPNLRWEGVPIREPLALRLRMSVELENDANACLLSELWFGHLDGVRNAVLLAISDGVGASLLADGQLITGHGGLAGEFGHVLYDPEGPLCGCGRRGCWEVFASTSAALRTYAQHPSGARLEGSPLTYADLFRRAQENDSAARHALEQQAVAIGRGLRMVSAALAPEVISFAGEITLAWALIESTIHDECRRSMLAGEPPRLLPATGDGEVAHLLGAAVVVLQRHSGYFRSSAGSKAAGGQSRTARFKSARPPRARAGRPTSSAAEAHL